LEAVCRGLDTSSYLSYLNEVHDIQTSAKRLYPSVGKLQTQYSCTLLFALLESPLWLLWCNHFLSSIFRIDTKCITYHQDVSERSAGKWHVRWPWIFCYKQLFNVGV
jgi:hypothetical protein